MKKSNASGLGSAMLGILILLSLLPTIASQINEGLTYLKKRNAADHLKTVNAAVGEYIRLNHVRLLQNCTASKGETVTIKDLKDDDLLPDGFAERNVWYQEYKIYIRQPKDKELQGIVLTDSNGKTNYDNKFVNTIIPSTATFLGGAGGFVPSGNLPNQSANSILGSYGMWEFDLTKIGIPSPGAGHLAALATFGSSELGLDFLYRVAVPGEPELNAMQTNLDMTDYDINNLRSIKLVSHSYDEFLCEDTENENRLFYDEAEGLYICRNGEAVTVNDTGNSIMMKNATIASDGDYIDKPMCPAGTNTQPYIFVSPSIVSSGEEAVHLAAIQSWATDVDDTKWQIHLRVLNKKDEWIYPQPNYNKMTVVTVCGTASEIS